MDIFLEYLMVKKSTAVETTLKICIAVIATFLSVIVFLLFASVSFLRTFSFFAVLCIGYAAYILISRMSIEYEYIFTNGDLDIDIIRGKKVRKRLVTVKCRNIRNMEKTTEFSEKTKTADRVINAVYNPALGEIYKIDATVKDGKDATVFFQPTDALIAEMKKYNPSNIKS
ncbi:MAG: hypothetical protein E7398_01265 [Ruminococcaceae bacterium]|nr:hypothetical protein [Oscillospiraceae bacterium]